MDIYTLLEKLLDIIENTINQPINIDILASRLFISSTHLRRIFKFSFGLTLSQYIRSRKLSASLDCLLNSRLNIIEIAFKYGFAYEQSYIRAFKREFGISPGELRKCGLIVKITPPLQLFNSNKLDDSVFFGPAIVMVPTFNIIGKQQKIPFNIAQSTAPKVAKDFWHNDKCRIVNTTNSDVYIGLTRVPSGSDYSFYTSSIQVDSLDYIPDGLCGDTFETSLCAKFHYIGNHHYYDLDSKIAEKMYSQIQKFGDDPSNKYVLFNNNVYFERIDTSAYDGKFCMMEWFTPVTQKHT